MNNPSEDTEHVEVYPPPVIQVSDSSDEDDDDDEYQQYASSGYALLPSEPENPQQEQQQTDTTTEKTYELFFCMVVFLAPLKNFVTFFWITICKKCFFACDRVGNLDLLL